MSVEPLSPSDGLTPRLVPIEELFFDRANPRLQEPEAAPDSQDGILEVLWRDFAVDEIALSIAANGYFEYEPLFATRESGRLVVVEGNRRLAAVKLLRDPSLRRLVGAADLPRLSHTRLRALDRLPVIERSRADLWYYVGFKHVNGPQAWRSYSKAQYIAWVHNSLKIPLDTIARQIGDKHATVIRLYRTLMVIEQAERSGVFSRDDRFNRHFSFSHMLTGLGYSGIQAYLGLQQGRAPSRNPVPRSRIQNLGQVCLWLYGSRGRNLPPVVQSQNPDLRLLDEVLQSEDGTASLRRGLPLVLALDASRGDERIFRESLIAAKQYLQEARGKLLSGYSGEADLLETAEDVLQLAEDMHEHMREKRASRSGRRASSRKR